MLDDSDEALLLALPHELRRANGVPDEAVVERRSRAAELAARVLADVLYPDGLRTSPLGAGWSRDIDLHVLEVPDAQRLLAHGWIPLDGLLRRIGSVGDGRWAVMENGHVLAAADLHKSEPPRDAVGLVLARCVDRREVRLREVLELRVLERAGHPIPYSHPVSRAAKQVEATLLGTERATGGSLPPVSLGARSGFLRRASALRLRVRPRVVIALSGVDGAGKSTLARALRDELTAAAIPVGAVWARPGMGLGPLAHLAALAKRALREAPEPGIRAVAAGNADAVRSRRGSLAWAWTTCITLAFIADARRQHARSRGVVVWDRHVYDGLATLAFAYPGRGRRLAEGLVRRLLPSAAITVYLEIPAEVAAARKPGDTISRHAIDVQLLTYQNQRSRNPGLLVLDGTRPLQENVVAVLRGMGEL